MTSRKPLLALTLVLFAALLLAGCGGGNEQSGNGGGSQGGSGDGTSGEQAQKSGGGGKGAERKIALGTISRVNPEANRIAVTPSNPEAGRRLLTFRIGKAAKVFLAGREAQFGDLERGQQVQVKYVVKNGKNRAREVLAFPTGGGETTG